MRLLRALTLGYVAVLVPTLAASLIAIWVYLRRIAAVLGEVRAALAGVAEQTAPLASHVQPLRDVAVASSADLAQARTGLERVVERVSALGEQPGAAGPTG